jgi:uncharacterized protein (DUF1800 family)
MFADTRKGKYLMASTQMIRILAVLLASAWLGGCAGGSSKDAATAGTSSTSSGGTSQASSAAGVLVLGTASTTAPASSGSVSITVDRANASSGDVTVAYSTVNGTAVSGTNFKAASGTLAWSNGDSASKTVQIQLIDGANFSGAKQFALTLSSPTGSATLGSPATATISITGTQAVSNSPTPTNTAVPMGQIAAARLLEQGTMGATMSTVQSTTAQSYDAWFAAQVSTTPSLNAPKFNGGNDWSPSWWDNAIYGNDQLRQRMAFALSEILVISQNGGPIWTQNVALANYYDILINDAFSNYRTLLNDVTLSPAMGQFLATLRNNKPNPAIGLHADQNFAREVMQLFTVGLNKLNTDGTTVLGNDGNPIPTYGQADVEGLSNALTGWSFKSVDGNTAENSWSYARDEKNPMQAYPLHHDTEAKTIIGGVPIPAGGTAASDLKIALDTLFNHPNVGPFIGRQLIQRLVTSNPSPAYVQRVATVFNNDGTGVRGNLLAVAKAILTDPEAVNPGGNDYGKVREPLLRLTNLWRAFNASNAEGHALEWQVQSQGITALGQYPLYSPTVFNYFRPDFQPSGALTQANMVAPEIQITNEATLVTTANTLGWQSYQYIDGSGKKHSGPNIDLPQNVAAGSVMLHTDTWESLAKNPASLIDEMNLVLMGGQMTPAMRTIMIGYLNGISGTTPPVGPGTYVAEAAELIINSPQSAVQR